MTTPNKTQITVKFCINCSSVPHNAILKVSGNLPELGSWNPVNAFSLQTTEKEYPIWTGGILINIEEQTA